MFHLIYLSTVVGGTLPQRMPSCLATLDLALNWSDGPWAASSYVRAETSRPSLGSGGTGDAVVDAVTAVAQIMGVQDPAAIDSNAQFGDLGLDSLMGVEIKQALERNYALNLSAKEIRSVRFYLCFGLNVKGNPIIMTMGSLLSLQGYKRPNTDNSRHGRI